MSVVEIIQIKINRWKFVAGVVIGQSVIDYKKLT